MTADPLALLMSIPAIGPYVPYITLAVAVASALATALPAPDSTSGKAYTTVYNILHMVALNMGHAKAASNTKGT